MLSLQSKLATCTFAYQDTYLLHADIIYFGQNSINLMVPISAVAGDHVFDLKNLVIVDREHVITSQLAFIPELFGNWILNRWLYDFRLR